MIYFALQRSQIIKIRLGFMKDVVFFLFVIASFVSCSQYKLESMSATQIPVDKRADII